MRPIVYYVPWSNSELSGMLDACDNLLKVKSFLSGIEYTKLQ